MMSDESIRALVLAGGGSLGDYEVGVLKYVLGVLGIKYHIICGVSVGGINGGYIAQYRHGFEKNAAAGLERLWLEKIVGNESIYKSWFPFGRLSGLWKPSIHSTKPLRELIYNNFDANRVVAAGKKLRVGAVSLTTGDYGVWTENDKDLAEGILASSAFPIMFEPVETRDQQWLDGGLRNVTPLKTAIELGATTIDIINPSKGGVGQAKKKFGNVIKVAGRGLEIMLDEIMDGDLVACQTVNNVLDAAGVQQAGKYRRVTLNVLRPKEARGHDGMEFNPDYIKEGIELGFNDAKEFDWK
jgi:NTE family protein